MTAGTVVITGGVLAAVILLCIIVVLCYCRLQYYCCKKNGSDPDSTFCSQTQLARDPSSPPPRADNAGVTPLPLSPSSAPAGAFCPACSPYGSSLYIRTPAEVCNGAGRVPYTPAHHDGLSLSFAHAALPNSHALPDFYPSTRAISTEV